MICTKCDKDLAECVCPDLEGRYNKIMVSSHAFLKRSLYRQRIEHRIEEQKQEGIKSE